MDALMSCNTCHQPHLMKQINPHQELTVAFRVQLALK